MCLNIIVIAILNNIIVIMNDVVPQNEIDKYSEYFALGSRRPVLYKAWSIDFSSNNSHL